MKKRGFSLSEILIFLVTISIIVGISAPIFTKRKVQEKLDIPHGSYSCVHDGTSFVSSLSQGGATSITRSTAGCTFIPPVRARFFVITLVGAGGGGLTPSAERVAETKNGTLPVNCSSSRVTITNPFIDAFDDGNNGGKNAFMNDLLKQNTLTYNIYGGAGGWTRNYGRRGFWCGAYGTSGQDDGRCAKKGVLAKDTQWTERKQPGDGGGQCTVTFNTNLPLKVGDAFECVSGKNGANTPTDFIAGEDGKEGTFVLTRGSSQHSLRAYGGQGAAFGARHIQESLQDPIGKTILITGSPSLIRLISRHGINSKLKGTCEQGSALGKVAMVQAAKVGSNINHDHGKCKEEIEWYGQTYRDSSYLGANITSLSDTRIRKSYLSTLHISHNDEDDDSDQRVGNIGNETTSTTPNDLSWNYNIRKEITYIQSQGGGRGEVKIFERPTVPGLVNGVLTIGSSGTNTIGLGGTSDRPGGATKLNNGTLIAKGGSSVKATQKTEALSYAPNTTTRYDLRVVGLDGQKSLFEGASNTAPATKGGTCAGIAPKLSDCTGASTSVIGAGGGGGGLYYQHAGAYGSAKLGIGAKIKGQPTTNDKKIIGAGGKGGNGAIYISW